MDAKILCVGGVLHGCRVSGSGGKSQTLIDHQNGQVVTELHHYDLKRTPSGVLYMAWKIAPHWRNSGFLKIKGGYTMPVKPRSN